MGYIIGPDGKIVDDGQNAFAAPPDVGLTQEQMAEAAMAYSQSNPQPFTMPNVAPDTIDPYATPTVGQGPSTAVPLPNPYTGKKPITGGGRVKVKESISGPNGKVPGNTDPYSFTGKNAGQKTVNAGMGMINDAANMGNEALGQQEQAAELDADAEMQLKLDEEAFAGKKQEAIVAGADELKVRREKRANIAIEAKQEAVKRVQQWETEMQKAVNTEVDPSRYWNNRSGFQKAMFALGAAAGSMSEHVYGKNTAFDLLQKNIVQDIGIQSDKIDRNIKFMGDKRANIDLLNNLDRIAIEDLDQDTMDFIKEYDVRLGAMDKEVDKIIARYGQAKVSPTLMKTKADILNARASIRNGLGNAYMQEGTKLREMDFQKEESAKNRAHQSAMAKRQHQWELEAEDRKAILEGLKKGETNTFDVSLHGGGVKIMRPAYIDEKGIPHAAEAVKQGTVQVKKGMEQKYADAMEQNISKYDGLRAVKDLVAGEGFWDKAMSSAERNAAIKNAVLKSAVGSGLSPMSDNDIAMIQEVVTGSKTGVGEMIRPGDISKSVQMQIDGTLAKGRRDMRIYTEPQEGGGYTTWDPEELYVSPVKADTKADPEDTLAELAGSSGGKNRAKAQAATTDPLVSGRIEDLQELVDTKVKEGDIDYLERLAASLRETNSSKEKNADTRAVKTKVLKGRGGKIMPTVSKDSAMIEYVNSKLDELRSVKAMDEINQQRFGRGPFRTITSGFSKGDEE